MADSILRLRVDSAEYNNKLKRATEQLTRYADGCRKAGGTLQHVDDNLVEFTRSLGKMETTATTARGKVSELTKSYTELAVQYKNMTDEEKKGEYGKALAQSLDELKGRIKEGKSQLDDINKSINGGGGLTGALDSLAGKFGMNIKQLTGWGAALCAAKAALDVAKDAFNSSRDLVDEWGRTIQSAQSIYDGFLNALNTGDFSGFIGNMDDIAKAAREAYDAVSDLELLNAYNAGSLQRAKTGFTGSVADYRAGEGSVQGVKEAAETLKNQLRERKTAELNALAKAVNDEALKWGMDGKTLSEALKENFSEFTNRMHSNKPESYTGTGYAPNWGSFTVSSAMTGAISSIRTTKIPGTAEEKLSDFARRATPELLQKLRKYEVMSEATEEEIRQIDKQVTRMLGKAGKAGGSSGGKGGGGINEIKTEEQLNTERIQKLTQEYVLASKERQNAIRGEIQTLKDRNAQIQQLKDEASGKAGTLGMVSTQIPVSLVGPIADIETKMKSMSGVAINSDGENPFEKYKDSAIGLISPLQQLEDELKRLQEEQMKTWSPEQFAAYGVRIKEIQEAIGNFKGVSTDANKMAKAWQTASTAINTAGSAMSSLRNPAIDVMTVIAQSIASVALAYSQTLAQDKTSKSNIWSFIAAAAAATVSMATTISQIHSATGYAEGGEIKGNSYSGDRIPIMANAGEIVLNKAQQSTLASNLQNNGGGNFRLVGKLAGEDIIISAERAGKRMGYGQLMFWNGN